MALLVTLSVAGFPASGQQAGSGTNPGGLAADAPLTAANLRGHEALYNEGWFIVTSTRDALDYAYEHSVETSGQALARLRQDSEGNTAELGESLGRAGAESMDTGRAVYRVGGSFTDTIRGSARDLSAVQTDFALTQLSRSWDFVTGAAHYGPRADSHWARLRAAWPNQYGGMKQDASNILDINHRMASALSTEIEADWDGAFEEAAQDFRSAYEQSGTRGNSISALGDILYGYLAALYNGIVRPSARTIVVAGSETAQAASYVFTPTATSVSFVGRTVAATGLSVYHASAGTMWVMAPKVEAGLLTSLALLSLGSAGVTRLGGETLGLANQVAFTGAAGAATAGEAAGRTAFATGKYAALMTYDIGKASTEVVIQQTKSGAVLGYNALTAIPAHMLIAVPSAAIFLAYEGPKLVIVRATRVENSGVAEPVDPAQLPAGTVVDMDKLRARKDVKVEVLTDDPEVTQDVLEAIGENPRTPAKEAP